MDKTSFNSAKQAALRKYFSRMNEMQQEAVFHTEGPVLILAGAGSGKTRVLTHRIAYLIEEKGINPWNIMAITFTNKAAQEMRERVDQIVGFGSESIWVSTFHSSCVRMLRRYIDRLGYDNNFTIYDTDDQKSVRCICKRHPFFIDIHSIDTGNNSRDCHDDRDGCQVFHDIVQTIINDR